MLTACRGRRAWVYSKGLGFKGSNTGEDECSQRVGVVVLGVFEGFGVWDSKGLTQVKVNAHSVSGSSCLGVFEGFGIQRVQHR